MNLHNSNCALQKGLLAAVVLAIGSAPARSADTPALKDAFRNHFQVGTAVNRAIVTGTSFRRGPEQVSKDIALVKDQFNQLVAENDMKWAWVFAGTNPPPPGVTNAPAGVAADTNAPGTNRFGRGRFGGGFFGRYTGPRASRAELLERMRDHIHTVVGRYKGKVKVWDVVNEAIADDGTNILRNSLWLEIIGPDFIAKAFQYAHEADPDAVLRYNDYGLENPAKRRKLVALIKSLQEQEVPVHAIGSQAHVNVSISFETMDQALTEMAALGLPIHITELDVNSAQGGQRGFGADIANNATTTQGGLVTDADRRLAEAYAGLFRAFLKHDKHVEMVTFWGANDANSWRANGKPLLFDVNSQPKPAFDAVIAEAKKAAESTSLKLPFTTPPQWKSSGESVSRFTVSTLSGGAALSVLGAASPGSSGVPPAAARHWTADNGNGTYSNPLFNGEFEDPDMIRVGDDYYLVGTTMHMNPALEILHSKDLVNWELVGYCMERLDFGPAFRLEGGNIYGQGIWAPCIRYHRGTFYIFSNINGVGLQVFRSKSITGPWERNQLPGRHDLSVLFDDDLGKIFIISSAGNRGPDGSTTYPIEELTPDLMAFDTNAPKRQMVIPRGSRMGEGHHLYKINGTYYDISAIPGGPVDQMVARADSIDGPWEVTHMVQSESMGVTGVAPARAQANDRGLWLHQGGMCDTPTGEWWCVIMSDHGSAGRMVSLVPVTWAEGFPLIGLPGNLRKAPNTWIKPNTGFMQAPKPTYVWDEDFDSGKLNPLWQWNHVPDDAKWSMTEKPGVLRLHSLPAANFYNARNTVCQRPPGPECIITVELETTGMIAGDAAGLGLVSTPYAWIGVVKSSESATLQMTTGRAPGRGRPGGDASSQTYALTVSPVAPPTHLWLRVHCNFDNDQAIFSWSADGKQFTPVGSPFTMTFQLTTFQGVRPGLFHYNASGQPGGYADFDNFVCEEPRARGVERQIPMGKTIALTSEADDSFLAADTDKNALVNVAASAADAAPSRAKFGVVDLGQGRVALTASNGRFVSADGDATVLKDLAGKPPGQAESFQWINLMRGDTMLMSLTNHRYLATKPNEPGPVTITSTGPSPARKRGECFKWTVID